MSRAAASERRDSAPDVAMVGDFPLLVETRPPGLVGRYFVTQKHVLGLIFGGIRVWVRGHARPYPRFFSLARLAALFAAPFLDDLAAFEGDELGEVFFVFAEFVAELADEFAAPGGGDFAPFFERLS